MKKIKYLIFLFIIAFFLGIGIDKVWADFKAYYIGCCEVELNGSVEEAWVPDTSPKIMIQDVSSTHDLIFGCKDKNFYRWQVDVHSDCGGKYPCIDEGRSRGILESFKMFGDKVNDFSGSVFLTAVDSSGFKLKGNCSERKQNNNNSNNNNNNVTVTIPKKSCANYKANQNECVANNCAYNKDYKFCSANGLAYLKCGDSYDIPEIVPRLTSVAVTLLKTAVPLILIIVSIIQLVKSITANKEDDMKKAQSALIKKIIIAVIAYFVITIVQFVMLKVASDDTEKSNVTSCLSCFLNGTDKCGNMYYKDGYGYCYSTENDKMVLCD